MGKTTYINREIERKLDEYIKQFPAVAVTGPRQAGKSTMLKNIFGEKYNYVNFDDPLTRERALSDPNIFLESLPDKVILDEIQYVPGLLHYIKMSIDEKRKLNGRYILTGSQKFNLIKNLGDTLAGRIALTTLLPFCHSEIARANKKLTTAKNAFLFNCLKGAYPELVINNKLESAVWYGSYIQTYLERDIRTMHNIGNLREFQRFMQLLATRCSQKLNMNSLSNDLGVAVNTIKSWVSVLEASNIIYLLYPYHNNFGKRITKTPKIYFLDLGLVCYLTGLNSESHIMNGPMAGALFENYCIQETLKQFYNKGAVPRLYYLATTNESEIDLLIEYKTRLYSFEIKLTKSPNINMALSIERVLKIFGQKEAKILCMVNENTSLSSKVTAVNALNYFNTELRKII